MYLRATLGQDEIERIAADDLTNRARGGVHQVLSRPFISVQSDELLPAPASELGNHGHRHRVEIRHGSEHASRVLETHLLPDHEARVQLAGLDHRKHLRIAGTLHPERPDEAQLAEHEEIHG